MQFTLLGILAIQSQRIFAHATTALLSWHVQKFGVIYSHEYEQLAVDI